MERQVRRFGLREIWPSDGDAHPQERSAEALILRHAIEIFGRRGYVGTSTRSIAAAASERAAFPISATSSW